RGREMSAVELLHSAAGQIETGLADEPAARTEMRLVVAQGLVSLGETQEARTLLERSIEDMRAAHASPVPLALALHELAKAPFGSSDLEAARAAAQEALDLVADDATPEARDARIRVRTTLLRIANVQGRHADAVEIGTRNLEERRALLGADSPALAVDWNN